MRGRRIPAPEVTRRSSWMMPALISSSEAIYYRATGQPEQFIARMESLRRQAAEQPDGCSANWLQVYADNNRIADAAHVLDDARAAVASDPELLYQVAGLYDLIGRLDQTESILAGSFLEDRSGSMSRPATISAISGRMRVRNLDCAEVADPRWPSSPSRIISHFLEQPGLGVFTSGASSTKPQNILSWPSARRSAAGSGCIGSLWRCALSPGQIPAEARGPVEAVQAAAGAGQRGSRRSQKTFIATGQKAVIKLTPASPSASPRSSSRRQGRPTARDEYPPLHVLGGEGRGEGPVTRARCPCYGEPPLLTSP